MKALLDVNRNVLFVSQCLDGINRGRASRGHNGRQRRCAQEQHHASADRQRVENRRLVEQAAHPAQRDRRHCEPDAGAQKNRIRRLAQHQPHQRALPEPNAMRMPNSCWRSETE